jgi:hypothetical protein
MIWNWQQPDWPDFSYDQSQIDDFEKRLLLGAGLLFGASNISTKKTSDN